MKAHVVLKCLADPARIKVLHILLAGQQGASQLAGQLQIQPSTLNHQLNLLRECGLIEREIIGRERIYKVSKNIRVRKGAMHIVFPDLKIILQAEK